MASAARSFPSGAPQSAERVQPAAGWPAGAEVGSVAPSCVASLSEASLPVTGDWFRSLSWVQRSEAVQGLATLAVTTAWEHLTPSARLSRYQECGTQLPCPAGG